MASSSVLIPDSSLTFAQSLENAEVRFVGEAGSSVASGLGASHLDQSAEILSNKLQLTMVDIWSRVARLYESSPKSRASAEQRC